MSKDRINPLFTLLLLGLNQSSLVMWGGTLGSSWLVGMERCWRGLNQAWNPIAPKSLPPSMGH